MESIVFVSPQFPKSKSPSARVPNGAGGYNSTYTRSRSIREDPHLGPYRPPQNPSHIHVYVLFPLFVPLYAQYTLDLTRFLLFFLIIYNE